MSALQLNLPKRFASALSLEVLPHPTSSTTDSSTSNTEAAEVSTPLLPKKTILNSRVDLSLRRSALSNQHQTSEYVQDMFFEETPTFLPQETISLEPLSAASCISEVGSSGVCEESHFSLDLKSTASPQKDFNEEFYRRAEEYLDSLHLVIVLPEDHRRRPFNNLRVSTIKIMSKQASEPTADTIGSEYNSPGLISPSIHTSTLFKRRSSSRDVSTDSAPHHKQKTTLVKSPFYNCAKKEGQTIGPMKVGCERKENDKTVVAVVDSKRSSPRKNSITAMSINTKLKGMASRGHRDPSEILSATSLKMEEYSPLKLDV